MEKLLLAFTAVEVHDAVDVDLSLLLRSVAVGSFKGVMPATFILSLLEFLEAPADMLDESVLKSPTRPEVAGEDVVLVGELELVVVTEL